MGTGRRYTISGELAGSTSPPAPAATSRTHMLTFHGCGPSLGCGELGCGITALGAVALGEIMETNTTLRSLALSGNDINGRGETVPRAPRMVYWATDPDDIPQGAMQRWFYRV